MIIGANLRLSGSYGISSFSDWLRTCWIWSVLYYSFYAKLHLYEFFYNLTQFYINFSRQEYQIEVLYVSFNVWDSQVSFFLYSPFKVVFLLSSFVGHPAYFTFPPVRYIYDIRIRLAAILLYHCNSLIITLKHFHSNFSWVLYQIRYFFLFLHRTN